MAILLQCTLIRIWIQWTLSRKKFTPKFLILFLVVCTFKTTRWQSCLSDDEKKSVAMLASVQLGFEVQFGAYAMMFFWHLLLQIFHSCSTLCVRSEFILFRVLHQFG